MTSYEIKIEWDGPFKADEVIEKMNRAGEAPLWDGEDYGLYQIYGDHILCRKNTLLYIGIATDRTFSQRFKEHKAWLDNDQKKSDVNIYLGRVYDPRRHLTDKIWKSDVQIAERILIYIYSPNYNSHALTAPPDLSPHESIRLIHIGERGNAEPENNAPDDFSI